MYSHRSKIPIAILIFDNNTNISYKAFSPSNYNMDDDTDESFGQFLAKVYNRIAYYAFDPNNDNTTNFGKLREVHTRYIDIPLEQRTNMVFFSTYVNQYCHYKPIHSQSPITFDPVLANDYSQLQNQLIHESASHEFV